MKAAIKIFALAALFVIVLFSLISCKSNGDSGEESVKEGTKINVTYSSESAKYGYVEGELSQTISYKKSATSKVTAIANLGYAFSHWSDGVTSPTRENDSPSADTKLVAHFTIMPNELPIIWITTNQGAQIVSKDTYIKGKISVLNTDEKYHIENLDMQIRGRGNYTWGSTFNSDPMYNKRPYRIKLSKQQKLCGVGEGKSNDWVLLADHCDQSLLRNNIVYTFASMMPDILWQPHVQSVEVFLNGEYNGVYLLCEQVEVNKNKINVSEDLSSPEIGFLVMYSNYTDMGAFGSFEIDGYKYETKSDFSDDPNLAEQQRQYIYDKIYDCWQTLKSGNENRVRELIDLDSLIESYIVQELFKNLDTGHDNFYMSMDIGGKLKIGPVWDFDQCAGNADEGVDDYTGIRGGYTQPWYSQLLEHAWFKKLVLQKWNDLKTQIDSVPEMIIETAEKGYNSYCRNFEKWKIFGYRINRETYVRQFTTYKEHYSYFSEFMTKRIAWLDSYFKDASYTADMGDAFNGEGTKESPYIISSAQDFYLFTSCLLSGENFADMYFLQTANIDMTDITGYVGAGSSALFAGIYNGNGYSIKVSIRGLDGCVFPYVSGTVINLITKGNIENSGNAAGIARSVRSGGAIVNCISYMSLISGDNSGGIAASNQPDSVIVNCFFSGEIREASHASPICVWYDGRYGTYLSNFFIEGLRDDVPYVDVFREESPLNANQIRNELSPAMNNNLNVAADSLWYVEKEELCLWRYDEASNEATLVSLTK